MGWKENELTCFEYIKRNYTNDSFEFTQTGSSDSTESDIKVLKNKVCNFFIEVKSIESQCGQFVLIPENNNFIYSSSNKKAESIQSSAIIEKMKENFDYYINPGTKGKSLNIDKKYFYEWIIDYYRSKNVKYFIFAKETFCYEKSNFVIFPLEKINEYCNVSATYRQKKSGSANPTNNNLNEINNILSLNKIDFSNIHFENKKLKLYINGRNDKFKLSGENYDYQFNHLGNNIYEIRRLSNTRNSNVIFSIKLINEQAPEDLKAFETEFI